VSQFSVDEAAGRRAPRHAGGRGDLTDESEVAVADVRMFLLVE